MEETNINLNNAEALQQKEIQPNQDLNKKLDNMANMIDGLTTKIKSIESSDDSKSLSPIDVSKQNNDLLIKSSQEKLLLEEDYSNLIETKQMAEKLGPSFSNNLKLYENLGLDNSNKYKLMRRDIAKVYFSDVDRVQSFIPTINKNIVKSYLNSDDAGRLKLANEVWQTLLITEENIEKETKNKIRVSEGNVYDQDLPFHPSRYSTRDGMDFFEKRKKDTGVGHEYN